MHPVMILMAASAVSISAGWKKLPAGGYEYIIQIEPEAVATLVDGEEFTSDVPPEARDVRSYRVRVGRGVLPREGGAPQRETGTAPIDLGPPPADTTLPLGDPPVMPGEAATPPAADPSGADPAGRHVGIHGKGPTDGGQAPSLTIHEAGKVGDGGAGPGASKGAGSDVEPAQAALWPPLLGSLLALFASVGGNIFLGWTAVTMRGRYRALLAHQQIA